MSEKYKKQKCDVCNMEISKTNWSKHIKSQKHIDNVSKETVSKETVSKESNNEDNEDKENPFIHFDDDLFIKSYEKIKCEICKIRILKKSWKKHLMSKRHLNGGCLKRGKDKFIEKTFEHESSKIEEIFFKFKDSILKMLNGNKFLFLNLHIVVSKTQTGDPFDYWLSSKNTKVEEGSNKSDIYEDCKKQIINKFFQKELVGSGWTFDHTKCLQVRISDYKPLKNNNTKSSTESTDIKELSGSSYIDLPEKWKNKKACINVQNNDNKCFMWSILSALHPVKEHTYRVSKYKDYVNELNFTGIEFPVKLKDIAKFEKLNHISVNVYYITNDSKNSNIEPLLISKNHNFDKHVDLLLLREADTEIFNDTGNSHYVWIKNISALIGRQLSKHEAKKYICNRCLRYFDEKKFKTHIEDCKNFAPMRTYVKNKNYKIEFKNHSNRQKHGICIYADFESIIVPIDEDSEDLKTKTGTKTTEIAEHRTSSYYYVITYNDEFYDEDYYIGEDANVKFIDSLIENVKKIVKNFKVKEIIMDEKDKSNYEKTLDCKFCNKKFNDDVNENTTNDNENKKVKKVADHDHYTGKYRQALCSSCNINKLRKQNFIPVIFHNLQNYDSHLIFQHLTDKGFESLSVIPCNSEKYISFSFNLPNDNKKEEPKERRPLFNHNTIEIRFLDSYKFLSESLDSLSKNLPFEKKPILINYFKKLKYEEEDQIKLLSKKGFYPYEYVDSFERYKETSLPPIEKFYSKISNSNISNNDYNHAINIWNEFKIKNLGEYHRLYNITDVLILADVFTNFRNICYKTYKLDPLFYYTTPGLAWDAMLLKTEVKLDCLYDENMYLFVEKGIRGGIVQCSKRKSDANNKYLSNYMKIKKSIYLMYVDANNLYGWAMSLKLPTGNFEWEENIPNIDELTNYIEKLNTMKGCFLEVDLDYPKEIHDKHKDLPFCAQKSEIVNEISKTKTKKLILNVYNKEKYVIHYKNLQQALDNGLELKKIHRILKFDESEWLKEYIDLNTKLRAKAQNNFEKDFFKLMNNSVFGKTMENVRKRVDIKLVIDTQKATKLTHKPNYKKFNLINDDLISLEFYKTSIKLDRPIYVGFSILELSKTLMYAFYYDILKPKYGENISLCYMDTDSFILEINTDDVYEDFKEIKEHLDTSDYPENHYLHSKENKKVIGKFKDEMVSADKFKVIRGFVGLRSKMYALEFETMETMEIDDIKKAKGVKKGVVKTLTYDDYVKCVTNKKASEAKKQYSFQSKKHIIKTIETVKKVLDWQDDKRYILENGINTLPYGHYKID